MSSKTDYLSDNDIESDDDKKIITKKDLKERNKKIQKKSSTHNNSDSDDDNLEDDNKDSKIIPIDESLSSKDIKNIAFEKINEDYNYGLYGDFKVIMMNNGYINATQMCNDYNDSHKKEKDHKNKELTNWKRSDSVKEFIKYMANRLQLTNNKLMILNIKGSNRKTHGTYMHPQIILKLAIWISNDFYCKVNDIITKHFSKDVIAKKQRLLDKKDGTISELEKKVDKLLKQNKQLLKESKSTSEKVTKLLSETVKISSKLHKSNNKKVVPTGKKKDSNTLVIVKNNLKKEDGFEYTVFRAQQKSIKKLLSKHFDTHPKMKITLQIDENPNSMNLWMRIKNELDEHFESCIHRNFSLYSDYTEKQLIKDIQRIYDERFNTDHSIKDDDSDDDNSDDD